MKKIAITSTLSALLAATSHGDIIFTAPGMAEVQGQTGSDISESAELGEHWKYIITGYTWQLSAGQPTSGSIHSSGHYVDANGDKVTLSSKLSASVNGQTITSGNEKLVTDRAVADASENSAYVHTGGTVTLAEPIVISNEDIKVLVSQSTGMTGDSGSFIQLIGSAIKETPTPSGTIEPINETTQTTTGTTGEYSYGITATESEDYYLATTGTTPMISWSITKDADITTAPTASAVIGSWDKDAATNGSDYTSGGSSSGSTASSGGSSSGSTSGSTASSGGSSSGSTASSGGSSSGGSSSSSDSSSSSVPKNKTNNGHGNNADGVDVSNPGKSAEKWAERGIIDASLYDLDPNNDDDESKGGGAAPSKGKGKNK